MPRAAVFALLVASVLTGSLEAQLAGATFRGNAAGAPVRSGFVGQRSFPTGFFPNRFHFRHNGVGGVLVPYYFPDYQPFGYEQPYAEAVTGWPAPPMVIEQRDEGQSRTPPAKPQIIEVPGVANSTVAKKLPPTIFILANGERLEARRFVLTASNLSVSIDRRERTIPLDMLDVDATIVANRERGIDLRVPADRNEIFLSF